MSNADTVISINLKPLEKLRGELAKKIEARVGIRANTGAHTLEANQHTKGKKSAPLGLGSILNVTLGIIHEFGSETKNIPPRSFLRMPMEMKKDVLIQFLQSKAIKKLIEAGNVAMVYKLLGIQGENIVHDAFATGGFGQWRGLEAATVARKGSSAILIDTRQLERAVSSWVAAS